ncbi:hypothetical protein [Collinsella tanakaei]|uniref:hypothetical protein n=1 Tax=Collinsella tanakaei TaxID=626935 RepID=UPI0022E7CB9B|nr:hypothetical protein [Collinsella tanakaei]
MTITNDERREVAARLRDFDRLRPVFTESNVCAFSDALGAGYLDWEQICARLADLIEPEPERTCHMRDTHWDDGQCTWGCICSECGARHEHEYGRWLNYCPNCGARVTGDEK